MAVPARVGNSLVAVPAQIENSLVAGPVQNSGIDLPAGVKMTAEDSDKGFLVPRPAHDTGIDLPMVKDSDMNSFLGMNSSTMKVEVTVKGYSTGSSTTNSDIYSSTAEIALMVGLMIENILDTIADHIDITIVHAFDMMTARVDYNVSLDAD